MSGKFAASIARRLALSLVAVGLAAFASSVTPAKAQDASAKAAAADALAGTLSQTGRVRVIVQLQGDFQPEHDLAAPEGVEGSIAVALQRAAIRQGQDRVLADLAGTSVSSTKRFQFVPYMGLSVDGPGLDALVRSPNVAGIQEDRPVPPTLFQSVPLIGGNVSTGFPLGLDNFSGAGQMVAVLDTGVQSAHPFLAGKVLSEACYSTNDATIAATSLCPGGVASSTALGSGEYCNLTIFGCEHGTHVAGIAAGQTTDFAGTLYSGVAKDASILAIQVFTRFDDDVSNGFICSAIGVPSPCALTFTTDQILGLERVYALRSSFSIAAANMSLGGGFEQTYCDTDARKPIIDQLRAAGIATVIASGNSGFEDGTGAPACVSSAVTVGSTTKTDTVSSFSNNSFMVDLLAPGSSIGSSVPFNSSANFSGTSMATPHVAGAFAVLKSSTPAATVTELELALKSTGTTISETRLGVPFSKPRINVDLALAFAPSSDNVVADFNADLLSDILWRHVSDGRTVIWQMNGMALDSSAVVGVPPAVWRIEEIGDFNDDGFADILWRNNTDFRTVIWRMNGFTLTGAATIGNADSVWAVEGIGDFDGNGLDEILWRHTGDGRVAIWRTDGFAFLSGATIGAAPLAWQIAGIGDFNGDGMSDILWHNGTDGRTVVWEMNGFTLQAGRTVGQPPTVWRVEGVGDFNGDGQPDILWRHNDGRVVVWQMNGYAIDTSAVITAVSGAWRVVRLTDHNGDGMSDILWRNDGDGRVVIWQMNGLALDGSSVIGTLPAWEPM